MTDWEAGYAAGRERAEAALAAMPLPSGEAAASAAAADPYRGVTSTADLQAAIDAERGADVRAQDLVRVAEVSRPGSGMDAFDRETAYRQDFMRTVGRPLSIQELAGPPVEGCAACGRMAGLPCDEHRRRMGEPIPLPDHPWPSEMPGHYPGAIHLPPYNVANSVK